MAYLVVVQDCSDSSNDLAGLDLLKTVHESLPACMLLLRGACGVVLPQLDLQYNVSEKDCFELELSGQPVATQSQVSCLVLALYQQPIRGAMLTCRLQQTQ